MSVLERLAYGAAQGVRLSWFFGQKIVAARMSDRVPAPAERRQRMPTSGKILRDLVALAERDLRNVEEGRYALPADLFENPARAMDRARRFFADLERVNARRREDGHSEVLESAPKDRYPRYYLQNFHYQTDGWLSADSASLYDHQVEVLFGGGAGAMRRQALIPLGDELARIGVRGRRLVDIACGTGRFLREVKHNFPRLAATGIDMSPFYLAEARRAAADWSGVTLAQGAAERLPLPDAGFDLATAIYLFHELPPGLRRRVAAEIARVVRPGGLFVLVDSLQLGDVPEYDALLEHFPESLHEPYYAGYIRLDLQALFGAAGLALESSRHAYFSKIVAFRRR
jgi:ubiquinone/menaquinone biosynthesis C-methylase UbiE